MEDDKLGLFIDGWNSDDDVAVELGEFLESDSESFNAFMEEPVIRQRAPVSIADTAAKLALQMWSNMTPAQKHQQIATALRNDKQNITFHKLPTALNLTVA